VIRGDRKGMDNKITIRTSSAVDEAENDCCRFLMAARSSIPATRSIRIIKERLNMNIVT
jgi:hypothetical protein